jgi:hypothetical protein
MTLTGRFYKLVLTLATLSFLVPLAACGGNPGGSMQCGSYRALDTTDRLTTVKTMIDQQHGNDAPAEVDGTELSVDAYCFTHPSNDQIGNVYHG